VLVVVNLDPIWPQGGWIDLDLGALGVDPARAFTVHDLVSDRSFSWAGTRNYVELRPAEQVCHIFRVTQAD
jgi:starch synthase (maltosyl-transferring)